MTKSTKKMLMIGGGVAVVFLAHKHLAAKKASAAAPAASLGANEEYARYSYRPVNGRTVCFDNQTRRQVSADLCQTEVMRGVGGLFG